MSETPKSDSCKENKRLYKDLAEAKMLEIKQTLEDLIFFRNLYSKELFSESANTTHEIIKQLEEIHEQDKTEYLRLKAISVSGIIS